MDVAAGTSMGGLIGGAFAVGLSPDEVQAFAEGIVTGHPSMPEFRLAPDQINGVIAYLKSLER